MANLRRYEFRRLTIIGGEVQQVRVRTGGVNVLRFINWGTKDLKISLVSDPINYPMAIANAGGGTNNLMDPAGIEHVWLYSEDTGDFGMVEMDVEDPLIILAMESVVANLMTSLPTGGNHIGSVGIDVGGTPISSADPLPVTAGAGTVFDVSDRSGRLLGILSAGTNNIGDVDVLTLPAGTVAGSASLPAGTNNIGDVDVLTLPAGTVAGSASLPAGINNIGDVDVLTLPAGTVAGSASLPAGTNNIGDVDVITMPVVETKPATGVAPVKTNAAGAGEVTIKATAGRVFSFVADVAGTLRDGTGNDVYIVSANQVVTPARPLEYATSIIFNAGGAGNIYTQHE